MAAPSHVRWTKPLWTALGRLQKLAGFDKETGEEILRNIVFDISGQRSTRRLSPAQAREVLQIINEKADAEENERDRKLKAAGESTDYRESTRAGRSATEDSNATITREQSTALLQLASLLDWGRPQLQRWIRDRMKSVCQGAPWPQTRGQATKLHEGLEAIVMRRDENQAGMVLLRAKRALRAPDLRVWEEKFLRSLVIDDGELLLLTRRQTMKYRSWRRLVKLREIESKRAVPGGGR